MQPKEVKVEVDSKKYQSPAYVACHLPYCASLHYSQREGSPALLLLHDLDAHTTRSVVLHTHTHTHTHTPTH